jgi:NTP pyrophosphatase (non-canonical NTP hydrolase)
LIGLEIRAEQGGRLAESYDPQEAVARFVERHQLETSVEVRTLDLVSEVGELAKEVLKGTAYGREPFAPTDAWTGELGDAFFSLLCVANGTGVDLEAALQEAMAQYERRVALRGDLGSG